MSADRSTAQRAGDKTHGTMVREAREAKRLTLRQLAAATGLSAPFLSDVEHGRRRLTGDTLAKVALALGIPVAKLQRAAMFEDVKARYPELAELLENDVCKCCRGKVVLRGD